MFVWLRRVLRLWCWIIHFIMLIYFIYKHASNGSRCQLELLVFVVHLYRENPAPDTPVQQSGPTERRHDLSGTSRGICRLYLNYTAPFLKLWTCVLKRHLIKSHNETLLSPVHHTLMNTCMCACYVFCLARLKSTYSTYTEFYTMPRSHYSVSDIIYTGDVRQHKLQEPLKKL